MKGQNSLRPYIQDTWVLNTNIGRKSHQNDPENSGRGDEHCPSSEKFRANLNGSWEEQTR